MVKLRSIVAAVASTALLIQSSLGHSTKRNPVNYVSLVDDAVIKTPSHRVHSHSKFDLTFNLHEVKQKIRLVLEPNHDLINSNLAVTYLRADGTVQAIEPVDRASHRVYRGQAFVQREGISGWSNAGWARITVHQDGDNPVFDGAFRIDGDNHHVQTRTHYERVKHDEDPVVDIQDDGEVMVVWRDSDVSSSYSRFDELKRDMENQESICDSDSLDFNNKYDAALDTRSLFGRQSIDGGGSGDNTAAPSLVDSIGSVSGCPTTRKIALVGIATDCTYWKDFDTRLDLQKHVIGMVNQASEVYESTFKISLGVGNLTISEKVCPGTSSTSAPWNLGCGPNTTISDRLSLFSAWRGQFTDKNAYWSLLTLCNTDSAVGLAWRGQLCRAGSGPNKVDGKEETIAATNVVVRTPNEWQIFAHETGHTFGAVHDCDASACPLTNSETPCCPLSKSTCSAGGKFIMNPSTGPDISKFSPCSIGNICSSLKTNTKGDCLTDNKNVDTFLGSQCGNGIVEKDEDCDCGGDQECKDNGCCNPDTCKFSEGSDCDPTNEDCCTKQCKFASSGTTCRASTGDCDPAEKCSGTTANCPDDGHKKDGESCGKDLSCASGQCTSRDMQCKVMMGSQFGSNDTSACGGSSCLLTCTAPEGGADQCTIYNQNFLDGTDCGGGGRCSNGSCEGSSTSKEILDWLKQHKNIVIPVGAVIGGLILLAIANCIFKSIRRRRRLRRAPKATPMTSMSSWPSIPGQGQGQGPQGQVQQNMWQQNRGQGEWQPEYHQRENQWTPPRPEPIPSPRPSYPHPGTANEFGRWNRTSSMRYA